MVRREQLRLHRIFQRLLLLSLAVPGGLQACSNSSSGTGEPGADGGNDAGTDSTVRADTGAGDSARVDSGAGDTSTGDRAGDGGSTCQMSDPYYADASYVQLPDSGPDSPYYPCYYFVDLPCGSDATTGTGNTACYLYLNECTSICTLDGGFVDCLYWQGQGCLDGSLTAQPGQPATIACGVCNGVGRRPRGLRKPRRARAMNLLGEYFAQAAHLEAASVVAFERLRDELRAHGAPSELVEVAARSIRDEVRHARVTTRLARRYGAIPSAPRTGRARVRSLESFAVENAAEGCVRETFGAMLATWQAAHAREKRIRRSMARIAHDETRHAALAWAVARWAEGRLDERARRRVVAARRTAVARLMRDLGAELPPAVRADAGLPSAREARALAAAMTEVWS